MRKRRERRNGQKMGDDENHVNRTTDQKPICGRYLDVSVGHKRLSTPYLRSQHKLHGTARNEIALSRSDIGASLPQIIHMSLLCRDSSHHVPGAPSRLPIVTGWIAPSRISCSLRRRTAHIGVWPLICLIPLLRLLLLWREGWIRRRLW